MKTTLRRLILICFALFASLSFAPATHAAPTTCTSTVRISGTDFGTVVVTGNEAHYHDFQVAGAYESGMLARSTVSGAQEVRQNQVNGRATVQGSYVVTSSEGTLTTRYNATIDGSGQVKGSFTTHDGTGALADMQWTGTISGQLVGLDAQGLPTYLVTLSGPCGNCV